MTVFSDSNFKDHEQVLFVSDIDSGLKAIIAIHSTKLGPAHGGAVFGITAQTLMLLLMYFVFRVE